MKNLFEWFQRSCRNIALTNIPHTHTYSWIKWNMKKISIYNCVYTCSIQLFFALHHFGLQFFFFSFSSSFPPSPSSQLIRWIWFVFLICQLYSRSSTMRVYSLYVKSDFYFLNMPLSFHCSEGYGRGDEKKN